MSSFLNLQAQKLHSRLNNFIRAQMVAFRLANELKEARSKEDIVSYEELGVWKDTGMYE